MRTRVPVGIAAAELWLPNGRADATDAVAGGLLRKQQAAEIDHPELPSAGPDEPPPDMAVRAGRATLERAAVAAADVGVLCHAWMYYQGHDLWSPAHYIARELNAYGALPVGIQQVCNGGCAGVELTAARLTVPHEDTRAPRWGLVTTADRFGAPGFDRWASDYGVAYGDAGTALLLQAPAGPGSQLILRSVATAAAPELEAMHRGSDAFALAPHTGRAKVDMRATKRAFLMEHGSEPFVSANARGIHAVLDRALRDGGMDARDARLRCAVLPRFGRKILEESWIPLLETRLDAELIDAGRRTGHLGAGDGAAGVADLLRKRSLAPGEAALVLSAGAGFSWSCLLVQAPEN